MGRGEDTVIEMTNEECQIAFNVNSLLIGKSVFIIMYMIPIFLDFRIFRKYSDFQKLLYSSKNSDCWKILDFFQNYSPESFQILRAFLTLVLDIDNVMI